jgi:hypothetical protein
MAVRILLAVAVLVLLAGCSDPSGPSGDGADADADGDAAAPPAAEAGIVTGRLTAAASQASIYIPVKVAGHGRLAIALVLATNLPENSLDVQVSGPGDRAAAGETSPFLYVFPGTRPTLSFGDPPVGTWTADVTLSSGTLADYELHWCADDQDAQGPASNFACHHY